MAYSLFKSQLLQLYFIFNFRLFINLNQKYDFAEYVSEFRFYRFNLPLELSAEENKVDVDKLISVLNKLYKKKSKYTQIQTDDEEKLEKVIYFIILKYF